MRDSIFQDMDKNTKAGGTLGGGLLLLIISWWGNMRDAQDLTATLFGLTLAEIYFILMILSAFVLSFGISWLINLNIKKFWAWKNKRPSLVVPGTRVIKYLADKSLASTSFRGDQKYQQATDALLLNIKNGKISVGMLQGGAVEKISKKDLKGINFSMITRKHIHYPTKEDGVLGFFPTKDKSALAEEVYFDENEIFKLWPGNYGDRLA